MSNIRIAIPIYDTVYAANYVNAVRGAGMEAVIVEAVKNADCDGLLLPGGDDVNPHRYGQENNGSIGINDPLDELQLEAIRVYSDAHKPILGICRGLQLLNVYFGGTLIQDIETTERHSRCGTKYDKVHSSDANEGSWLYDIYGREFDNNSAHHQAIDAVGDGLIVDSICPQDGIIEAVHHGTLPIYAVQWHPERMCLANSRTDTVDGIHIFEFFRNLTGNEVTKCT